MPSPARKASQDPSPSMSDPALADCHSIHPARSRPLPHPCKTLLPRILLQSTSGSMASMDSLHQISRLRQARAPPAYRFALCTYYIHAIIIHTIMYTQPYFALKPAGRFSKKAFIPSFWSSVAKQRANKLASKAIPAS